MAAVFLINLQESALGLCRRILNGGAFMLLEKSAIDRWRKRYSFDDLADENDYADAFSRNLHFGTGGLRAKLGIGPNRLNIYTIGKATQGLAGYLLANSDNPSVAICRDSRHGSDDFARRTAEVLAANGITSYIYPRIEPTPALSFAIRDLECSAGVCITASHNPAEYNGYKVYGSDGCQITVETARAIQKCIDGVDIFDDVLSVDFDVAISDGRIKWIGEDTLDRYCNAILMQSTGIECSKLRLVYSPLNGTGLECVSRIFKMLGISDMRVVPEQAYPDGDFPTCPKPNPEVREALELGIKLGEQIDADLLLETDPDADRVGIAVPHDGEWKLLTGNETGILLLDYLSRLLSEGGEDLSNRIACTTIVSAPMADDLAKHYGFELRRTLTGFKFIGEQIGLLEKEGRAQDFLFGLEESYGYLAGTYVRDKDAVVACMLICEMAAAYKAKGMDLWEAMQSLYQRFGYWGNKQISITYDGVTGIEKMTALMDSIRQNVPSRLGGLRVKCAIDYSNGADMPVINGTDVPQLLPASNVFQLNLEGGSRVIVRPSGTEPKIKAYVFARADDEDGARDLLEYLDRDVRKLL